MEQKVILITGASGFIGTNLTGELLRRGCTVIAYDRAEPRRRFFQYRCISDDFSKEGSFDLLTINGDVCNLELLRKIFETYRIDYVIHLAALSTIQMGAENREETFRTNVEGTRRLLEMSERYGKVKGFLYASSDKVYGKLQRPAYTETDELLPLPSFYDQSKAQADRMVREWSVKYGVHGVVLRFCNIYGEYDLQNTRIIPRSIRACLENRPCVLRVYKDTWGNIRNYQRDFLYVGDLCKNIWMIIEKLEYWNEEDGRKSAAWGEAFNLGTGECYSMDKVIGEICKISGSKLPAEIEYTGRLAEIPRQCMDCTKARRYFEFESETSLEEGLQKTMSWWKRSSL